MAAGKAQSFVLHSGGSVTEYPLLDEETYEALVSAAIRIARLENTSDSHDEILTAVQSMVDKLQETDTEYAETLKDLDTRLTKSQNTADSNTKKYLALSEIVTNEQKKLSDEVQRAKDVEGDISDLDTTVKDNLVAAINWLLTKVNKNGENIGTLGDLATVQKDNLVVALNEIKASMVTASDITGFATTEVTDALSNKLSEDESKLSDAETKIAQNTSDIAQAKTDIASNKTNINSIDERLTTAEGEIDDIQTNENTIQEDLTALKSTVDGHTTEIGDLSTLTTTAKSDLVSAINEAAESGSSGSNSVNVISPQSVTNAPTIGNNGIAIGNKAYASEASLAIGSYARADAENGYAVAIGNSANSHGCGNRSVTVGYIAESNGDLGVAIGCLAYAWNNATALGYDASCNGENSVALGAESRCEEDNCVSVGNEITRRIINVTDPVKDQDAATKSYVDSSINSLNGVVIDPAVKELYSRPSTRRLLTQTLTASGGTLTWTDDAISDDSLIDVYASIPNIAPSEITQSGTTCTVTFDAQDSDFSVAIVVMY